MKSFTDLRNAAGQCLRRSTPKFVKDFVLENLLPEETALILGAVKDDRGPAHQAVMVDVGAGHGSTLEPFARLGWKVYGFEPDPANRKVALDLARGYPNVVIDPRAVTDTARKDVPFYRSDVSAGISGLSRFDDSHRLEGTVSTTTLSDFCSENAVGRIDYLKVDAEGFDFFVLKGLPWDRIRPDVIMCEFEDQKTLPLGYSLDDMAKFLADKGYKILVSEWCAVVKRGGPHTWRRFVRYPDAALKDAAWGNMIAVLDAQGFERMADHAAGLVLRWKIGNGIWKAWAFLTHG